MSYHYEDASHYRYSVPAHCEDTSYFYHSTSAHLVDTSQYSFNDDNICLNSAHFNNLTMSSSHQLSSIQHALELEAYAEAAMNRTYLWDEIHLAYRDDPMDSYDEPMQPLLIMMSTTRTLPMRSWRK